MTWLFAAILFIAATPPTDAEHARLNAMVVISSCSSSSWPHAQAELARAEMQSEIVGHLNKAAADLEPAGWRLKTLEVLVELTRSAQNNTSCIPANLAELADVLSAWRDTKGAP